MGHFLINIPYVKMAKLLSITLLATLVVYLHAACDSDEFTCDNGKCIPGYWKCDDYDDCGGNDKSDEQGCPLRCRYDKFVLKAWKCDGDNDCGDGSDEKDC